MRISDTEMANKSSTNNFQIRRMQAFQ